MRENVGKQFGRLPSSDDDREVEGRPTREAVVDFWADRYGIPRDTWEDYSFWERGSGKIWTFHGDLRGPVRIQGLGLAALRTGGEHWKPTTNAVQRFGRRASRNIIDLDDVQARRFLAGGDQSIPAWDGDWGYLIVAHDLAGEREPIGVGLYLHGDLRSQIPKGRRREL